MQMSDIAAGEYAKIARLQETCGIQTWTPAELKIFLSQNDNFIVVAKKGKSVIGFAQTQWTPDAAELLSIAVDPSNRGQGVGQKLMRYVLERVSSISTEVFLQTAESNRSAQKLFERCGFQKCGQRPRYYGAETAYEYVFRAKR